MRLRELLKGVRVINLDGDPETRITGVVYDSRKAAPGCVFVAAKGEKLDGSRFIPDAAGAGAAAVVFEDYEGKLPPGVAAVKVPDAREAMAGIASKFYGDPSSKLKVVGITGTNGKTTTSYIIKSVIEAAGKKTGLVGTISYMVGDEVLPAPNTTPESVDLQAHLAAMEKAGAGYAVIEVSSHSVVLKRVAGVKFAVRVFTNFTQDHLDFHGSMDEYYEAKKGFFTTGCGVCVVNLDDPKGMDIAASSCGGVIGYGVDTAADVMARDVKLSDAGTRFTLATPVGETIISSPLAGRHNVYNILAAAGACLGLDIGLTSIARGVAGMRGVPGRFERVEAGQDFTVLVDYAHTEDALARACAAAREFTAGRLITLFGCGGDRDSTKRPLMGETAARLSDVVVLTSDNPRTEDPVEILRQVVEGVDRQGSKTLGETYFVIPDRGEAIEFAAGLAGPGDTVLLAGKGHEDYQIVGTKKHHFDDREAARVAILGRPGKKAAGL